MAANLRTDAKSVGCRHRKQRWWRVGHQDAKLVTCRSINGFDMVTGQARFQEGDRIRFRRSVGLTAGRLDSLRCPRFNITKIGEY